jgi:hypothetical protein
MKSLHLHKWIILLSFLIGACNSAQKQQQAADADGSIKPYTENPRYWEYKGKPVLLLGATDNDNLFQMNNLKSHLDALQSAGGNYIRNTMSSRDSADLWPHQKQVNGLYDLDHWNNAYWQKFENLLKWCEERDIIVQIEVWDRFDYSREPWALNPFNPGLNINYNEAECGMASVYPKHPSSDLQPFFHSIPGMPRYGKGADLIRQYQEKLVDKILEYTFQYGNVLYCMNNETSTPVQWGNYWIEYIRKKAQAIGKEVYLTDMYDHFFKPRECKKCQDLIAQPQQYTFMDISQINSRNFGQNHWDTLSWIIAQRERYPLRPVNCTKVYGGNNTGWGSGTNDDGIARFCRDVLGGCAGVRHHRPPAGNGLNDKSRASIRAIRKIETIVTFWDLSVNMDLLDDRATDEAYLTVASNDHFVVYFPKEGSIRLDLSGSAYKYMVRWIDLGTGDWAETDEIEGGDYVNMNSSRGPGSFAVISRIR